MQPIIIRTNTLTLPREVVDKLNAEQVMIKEVSGGLLLTPIKSHPRRQRGMLRGKGFTSEKFLEQRREDRELET